LEAFGNDFLVGWGNWLELVELSDRAIHS